MRKTIERFANWILLKVKKDKISDKTEQLAKEPFVNAYFKRAMSEGNIEVEPAFVLHDGTEVYQTKVGRSSFELLVMATAEIPKQYFEYGLRKEKFHKFIGLVNDQLQQAKENIYANPIEAQDFITRSQDINTSLLSDFAFGDSLRQNLEISLCFLVTKEQNPYVYNYDEKSELLAKVLLEKERLIPFIFALPMMKLLSIGDSLQTDLQIVSSQEMKKMRAESKMQLNSLEIIGLLASRTNEAKLPWTSQELGILTNLMEVNTDTLPLTIS